MEMKVFDRNIGWASCVLNAINRHNYFRMLIIEKNSRNRRVGTVDGNVLRLLQVRDM